MDEPHSVHSARDENTHVTSNTSTRSDTSNNNTNSIGIRATAAADGRDDVIATATTGGSTSDSGDKDDNMSPVTGAVSFEQCSKDKAQELRDLLQDDVAYPESPRAALSCFLQGLAVFNIVLPSPGDVAHEVWQMFRDCVVDARIEAEMVTTQALNWCKQLQPLAPLATKGDGNCLLHAVSLAMWGVDDSNLFLRRLLHVSLVEDIRNAYQTRWRTEMERQYDRVPDSGLQVTEQEFAREWREVVGASSDTHHSGTPNTLPYSSLEEIHIFVLANILRRPIIVICDSLLRNIHGSLIADNTLSGIYLPLLSAYHDCIHYPIVIGYESSHFVPLVSYEYHQATSSSSSATSSSSSSPPSTPPSPSPPSSSSPALRAALAVPLVDHLFHSLNVHFCTDTELDNVEQLKCDYLNVSSVTIPMENGREESISIACLSQLKLGADSDVVKPLVTHLHNTLSIDTPRTQQHQQQSILPADVVSNTNNKQSNCDIDPEVSLKSLTLGEGSLCQHTYCVNRRITNRKQCPECLDERNRILNTRAPRVTMTRSRSDNVSLMSASCMHPGCPYKASTNCYPYCHQHTDEQHHKRDMATQYQETDTKLCVLIDKQTSTTEIQDLQEVEETGISTLSTASAMSLVKTNTSKRDEGTEASAVCVSESCHELAHHPINGLCKRCYIRKTTRAETKSNRNKKESPAAAAASSKDNRTLPCRTASCTGAVKPTSKCRLCRVCKSKRIIQQEAVTKASSLCKTSGCDRKRIHNTGGYCMYCYKHHTLTPPGNRSSAAAAAAVAAAGGGSGGGAGVDATRWSPSSPHRDKAGATRTPTSRGNSTSDLQPQCVVCGGESRSWSAPCDACVRSHNVMKREQSGRCLTVGCDYYGTTQNNGYCSRCVAMLGLHTSPSSSPSRSNPTSPNHIRRVKSNAAASYQAPPPPPAPTGLERTTGPSSTARPPSGPSSRRPASYHSGVTGHYSPLDDPFIPTSDARSTSTARRLATMAAMYQDDDRHTTAQPCLNRSCSLYGDPMLDQYCEQCYQNRFRLHDLQLKRIPVEYRSYAEDSDRRDGSGAGGSAPRWMSQQLNNSHDNMRNRKLCVVPGCDMYGNVRCNGLCNGCYAKVKKT